MLALHYKDIYTPEKIKQTVEDWYSKKTHQDYLKLMKSGDALLKVAEENGTKEYFCFVHRKNKIGQSFYQKKGFSYDESKSTVEDFYMCKKLS